MKAYSLDLFTTFVTTYVVAFECIRWRSHLRYLFIRCGVKYFMRFWLTGTFMTSTSLGRFLSLLLLTPYWTMYSVSFRMSFYLIAIVIDYLYDVGM